MGKIPPSMRGMKLPVTTTLMKNPSSQAPSPSPSPPMQTPFHLLKKPRKPQSKQLHHRQQQQETPNQINFNVSNLSEAKQMFTSLITSTRSPVDVKFHNSLLQSFSSVSNVQDSVALLRYMVKNHPAFIPDKSTYHVLLSQSCKMDDSSLNSVRQMLDLMITDGFPPDCVTADIAVRSLCTAGREEQAVELIKELSTMKLTPDEYTYNFIVRHLCKTRALHNVYDFIYDMRDSYDVKPGLITYTILIDNVCNSKNLREATNLLKVLREEGFKPDCFMYNTIMKGYCIMNRGGEAIRVYNEMRDEGIEPDLVTYNTLIFGLSKSGRVKEARKLLNVMVGMGHFPDAVTYTSLMNGMCREGNVLGAVALLEEMEEKGCTPNECTYNTLLHGLSKSKKLDQAIELYEMMKSGAMKLESGSYATFVKVLCREGRIAEAYGVFDYAVESKSLKDVVAYSTLETMLKSLKKLKEKGLAV